MEPSVPDCVVQLADGPEGLGSLASFILADGSGPARQPTALRVWRDTDRLWVRFDCVDDDIWGRYGERDDPLYLEEVVEVFLAPGSATPQRYFELEVSPQGTLFDARVAHTTGRRADMLVDPGWDCPGLIWRAESEPSASRWSAELGIPWEGIAPPGPLPRVWRANFYRIDRPRNGSPEFSCWSPTYTDPADFHRPDRFGRLIL